MTVSKKNSSKTTTKTRKSENIQNVEISNLPAKRIDENGNVDTTGLTTIEKKRYRDITSSLDGKNPMTVMSYGADLQKVMDSYSSELLQHQMSSTVSGDTSKLISKLMGELENIDVNDFKTPTRFKKFLMSFPFTKSFVTSVAEIKAKYNTIEKNVENIKQKLEATRTIALRDNNLLEQQFINNKDYVNQLEQLIIAGKFKAEELEEELNTMRTNGSDMIEINDTNNFKEALEKRVTDLVMLHHAFKQSLYQIRIIQQTNLQDANNTESQVLMLIPFWKNQLSLTVSLYNQQQSIKAKQAVYDAINKSLVSNSEMMKIQSIEVAKQNQRTVLDAETLMKTTRDLIETIQGVQKVQEEGKKKRMNAESKIIECEKQMTQAINELTNNNERIVSRELIGNEN
jgi:toxic anion resistance family protein